MANEIKLPELGENVEEAEVLSILVSEGDRVEKDQPLLELETDKATVEFPSPQAGVVRSLRVSEGDTVRIGQVLLEMDEGEGDAAKEKEAEAGSADEDTEADRADEGEEKAEARGEREEREKAKAKKGERAREKETEKEEEEAEPKGRRKDEEAPKKAERREPAKKAREEKKPRREKEPESEPEPEDERAAKEREEPTPAPPVPAAPSVRRLARELGVEVAEIEGSGPAGRISTDDVKAHVRQLLSARAAGGGRGRAAPDAFQALPDFSRFGEVEREGMSGIRRRTAENMTRSWLSIPHVAQHDRADVTGLEAARKRLGPRVEARGGKLTVTAIAIQAVARAMRVFPKFNASLDVESEEIVFKRYVHVGVAVDTEHGLIVPVIRDADRKGLADIAVELGDLSERARSRKIRPDDIQGSNLTVTNLGGLGTTTFAPLVNWPEVAVLGLGRARREPVWSDEAGEFAPRLVLPLSLSYDHRLIDGADAARFLRWLAEAFEDPLLLVLEG